MPDPSSRGAASENVVDVRGLQKTYRRAAEHIEALRGVDLTVVAGEVVAIVGPSGSGKSTLLNVLCGWEPPTDGTIAFGQQFGAQRGVPPRWSDLALIPQALGLLDDLTVRENITLPARLTYQAHTVTERVDQLLDELALAHLANRKPHETSLGEQQRAAVARALTLQPRLILADEPSSHQDADRSRTVYTALRGAAAQGAAVLVATHDEEALPYLDRVLEVREGVLHPIAA